MILLRLTTILLLLAAVPAKAEEVRPGSPHASLAEQLVAHERRTWELYARRDVAALAALTAEDYSDIYPDGTVVDRAGYLADVAQVRVDSFALSDFHVFMLAPESALVTYVARGVGQTPRAGEIRSEVAVTSGWALRNGEWRNVFYRENVQELNGNRLLPASSAAPPPPRPQPRPR